VRRRDFIASGLTVGALAAALPCLASQPLGSVDAIVAGAEERSARLRVLTQPLRDAMIDLDGRKRDPELLDDLVDSVEALLETNYLGELAPGDQADPRVQRRFRRASRRAGRALRRLVRRLESLSPERVAALEQAVASHPEALEAAVRRIELEVAAIGMPAIARLRLSEVIRGVSFRMQRQPLRGLLDDFSDRFQRTERLAARGSGGPAPDPGPARQQEEGVPGVESPTIDDDPSVERDVDSTVLGAVALGLGLGTIGILLAGASATEGYLILCVCVSVPIVIGVLLLLVAGGMLLSED
jgi:hypothetical protein